MSTKKIAQLSTKSKRCAAVVAGVGGAFEPKSAHEAERVALSGPRGQVIIGDEQSATLAELIALSLGASVESEPNEVIERAALRSLARELFALEAALRGGAAESPCLPDTIYALADRCRAVAELGRRFELAAEPLRKAEA